MNKDHNSFKEDKDNPIWSQVDFDKAKPAHKVLPKEFFEGMKRAREQHQPHKKPAS